MNGKQLRAFLDYLSQRHGLELCSLEWRGAGDCGQEWTPDSFVDDEVLQNHLDEYHALGE